MKFIFYTAGLLSLFLCSPVLALNVEVEALSDFSTDNPPQFYSVKIVEPFVIKKLNIESGSILEGRITVKEAKRLKRDATFTFEPTYLTAPDGTLKEVNIDCMGKYKKELDKKKVAKNLAVSAGNFAVTGFSLGYNAIEGVIKNEEGNRLKSSAVSVYEGSLISYAGKGKSLEIKQGEHFCLNFKLDDEEDDDADENDE